MLGLVNNQVVHVEPVLSTGGGFSVRAAKPDIQGRGKVYVQYGGENIQTGVQFFVMEGKAEVNPLSGQYLLRDNRAVIRAVFAGQHKDVEIRK